MANQQHARWDDLPPADWAHLFYPQRDYQYFREVLPGADIKAAIGTPRLAAYMADAAVLAYDRSGPDVIPFGSGEQFDGFLHRAELDDKHLIGDWRAGAKGTQGFFAFNSKFAVLSFRGTEKNDWTDLLVDLSILPVKETEDVPPAGGLRKTLLHLLQLNPKSSPFAMTEVGVHAGFQFSLNEVWADVHSHLQAYRATHPNAPIFFTGHSLGAALATLAIARFNSNNVALYTFGSPRTGNTVFCDQVKARADLGIFRFVDNQDVVTIIPPKDHLYDHTGGRMFIDSKGNVQPGGGSDGPGDLHTLAEVLGVAIAAAIGVVGGGPPPQLVDHSPSRYCYFLWKWAHGG